MLQAMTCRCFIWSYHIWKPKETALCWYNSKGRCFPCLQYY